MAGFGGSGGLVAHTPNEDGQWHGLEDHLRGTARLAEEFGSALGPEAGGLAYRAGLWHDLGKAHPRFQRYLGEMAAGTGRRGTGGDHKGAGALYASGVCPPLAFLIAGHHGGLPAGSDVKARVSEWRAAEHVQEALAVARSALADLTAPPAPLPLPPFVKDEHQTELFLRLLFSCVVDADFLDTEAHFRGGTPDVRQPGTAEIAALWERLSADQEQLLSSADSTKQVNEVRASIYRHAVEVAATKSRGFFRLTVPTGGGKTRTVLGFGLRHAMRHGQRRVIVAEPFTTVTEQTADVYRSILGGDMRVVLEHHSGAGDEEATGEGPSPDEVWRRLAAENWDVPVVVTTTVQLFESLLGNGTARCRKLHNVVNSVIVLDEAQTLPPRLLTPLLDVLRELVAHYRVSVVFCTATQPAFEAIPGAELIRDATEIAPDPPSLYRVLKRVRYRWSVAEDGPVPWAKVAEWMREEPQALAIVNTRKDALALLNVLDDPEALHLSTLLCLAHRRDVLRRIRVALKEKRPVRVIATQVVEAGVDLDFPLVLRAVGPLDSIVQAAGRCNREGELAEGLVVVFEPSEGSSPPPGEYRVATSTARSLMAGGALDLDDPRVFERFFRQLYDLVDTDKPQVQAHRKAFDYPEVRKASRLIDDDQLPLVVRPPGYETQVGALLEELRWRPQGSRPLLRQLQPFLVQVRGREAEKFERGGLMREVRPELGVFEWLSGYHPVRGLEVGLEPDLFVV